MFGLFKATTIKDDRLGLLTRSGRYWRGSIALGRHGNIALSLSGGRDAPDSASLALARELTARYDALLAQIQAGLFEHYEPYGDTGSNEDLAEPSDPLPKIERAGDVWPHVVVEWVRIEPLNGAPHDGPTIEIAYRVAWDEEHTIGARVQEWKLWELCGSVV